MPGRRASAAAEAPAQRAIRLARELFVSTADAARAPALWRSPLLWILVAVLVLHGVGIGWGLPASDGWDDDGIAPRDFLVGTAETYWPGHFYTYPPVHLLLLALLTLPVSVTAALRAHSLAPHDLVAEFIRVPYMTAFALTARLVTLLMSVGIVLALAVFARETRGRSAGHWTAATCGVNAIFTYYGHTTNLDVPYLFWSCLSLLAFARAMVDHAPARLRWALVFAALAVGTKDQAYALFALAVPSVLALWLALDAAARAQWRELVKQLALGVLMASALLLLVDGAVTNPSGFAARLRFLAGPASQNHTSYTASAEGILLLLRDAAAQFPQFYPALFAPLMLVGVVVAVRPSGDAARRVARMLPLFFALSFTLAFNFVARRSDHRFLLPQTVLLGVYAGFAIDALAGAVQRRRVALLVYPLLAALFGSALFGCLTIDAILVGDPRYDAERWLRENARPGDLVETYGNNVYLPHFPDSVHVTRVGPEPASTRNPLPNVEEIQDDYGDVVRRRPRWIVVSEGWAWRYMTDPAPEPGRTPSGQVATWQGESAARTFFRELDHDGCGYRLAHLSRWRSSIWPRVVIHASTALEVRIFERRSEALGASTEFLH